MRRGDSWQCETYFSPPSTRRSRRAAPCPASEGGTSTCGGDGRSRGARGVGRGARRLLVSKYTRQRNCLPPYRLSSPEKEGWNVWPATSTRKTVATALPRALPPQPSLSSAPVHTTGASTPRSVVPVPPNSQLTKTVDAGADARANRSSSEEEPGGARKVSDSGTHGKP